MKSRILDLTEVATFALDKIEEAKIADEVKKHYPYSLDQKVILKRNAGKFTFIFLMNKNCEDVRFISFTLFIVNRFAKGVFALKRNNFYEIVTLIENKKAEIRIAKELPDGNIIVFEENDVLVKACKKDTLINESVKRRRKIFSIRILLVITVIVFLGIGVRTIITNKKEKFLDSVKQEKIEKKQKEDRQKLLNEVLDLQKQFEIKENEKIPSVYKQLEHIYGACVKGDRVKSLNIEKNHFSLELYTKSAVKNLSRFENDDFFYGVKMNRLQQADGMEFVSFTGDSKEKKILSEEYVVTNNDTTDALIQKKDFYENQFKQYNVINKMKKQKELSVFINEIEVMLKSNNLRKEYIQSKGSDKSVLIEVYFKGQNKNVLEFTEKLCQKDTELLKVLRINNQENFNELQCIVILDTGIEIDALKKTDSKDFSFKAGEISSIFPLTQKPVVAKKEIKEEKRNVMLEKKKLIYIGEARRGNEQLVFLNDEETGSVYAVTLVDTVLDYEENEFHNNVVYTEDNKLIAKINGKFYEVKNENK